MPAAKRPRVAPTDDWRELRRLIVWPEQASYEILRPLVLYGFTPAERAAQTGVSESALRRRAARFDREGMASLFAPLGERPDDRRRLPAEVRRAIVELKAEYPAFGSHELAAICRRRFEGCHVEHRTVRRVLQDAPPPARTSRRFPPYRAIADPYERRRVIVRLSFEGWGVASIAGYLEPNRPRVYETIRRFVAGGWEGLGPRSSAPLRPARKADLKAMAAIRRLQANPELGEFRVHAALKQIGLDLSPRARGRILAAHRALYGLAGPGPAAPRAPAAMPFAATRRHRYGSVDVRYIEDHQLELRKPVYAISILENYSRALLASVLAPRQDLTAYLIVLRAAIERHGAPEALVPDSGGVFKAKQAMAIYAALGIDKRQIDRGRPWQHYIETHFAVMRRMADYHFGQAATWPDLWAVHARFFADYNAQDHCAHLARPEGRRSPAAVLGWVAGAWCDAADLARLFRLRAERTLDRHGYARFRHWRIYGERGLMRRRVALWLADDLLTLEFGQATLAQYRVGYAPDRRRFRDVREPRLFETRHRSPQRAMWELDDDGWRKAVPLAPAPPPRRRARAQQPALPFDEAAAGR